MKMENDKYYRRNEHNKLFGKEKNDGIGTTRTARRTQIQHYQHKRQYNTGKLNNRKGREIISEIYMYCCPDLHIFIISHY